MSGLIVQAFAQAEARARSLRGEPVLLLLDEADALAARRDTPQMHHEDRAGLNTVLQRLDNLRLTRLPLAAIFITNRPEALDPAIRRRAALALHFQRPGDEARAQIVSTSVPELEISQRQMAELVRLTGERQEKNDGVPFTASGPHRAIASGRATRPRSVRRARWGRTTSSSRRAPWPRRRRWGRHDREQEAGDHPALFVEPRQLRLQ